MFNIENRRNKNDTGQAEMKRQMNKFAFLLLGSLDLFKVTTIKEPKIQ